MTSHRQPSYEEVRDIAVDILTGKEQVNHANSQFEELRLNINEVVARRDGIRVHPSQLPRNVYLDELVRDVFWDLFRQGAITLGFNINNPNYPFFRLSHLGQKTLNSKSPWRFHDSSSYIALVRREILDISDQTVVYLEEAIQSFYAECLLASSVMLGVAAETEFLRLVDVAKNRPIHGVRFAACYNEKFIRTKITKFLSVLSAISSNLDRHATEDLDINFAPIQSVLRIARNEAGHPTAATLQRENVYVNLQLFVPFARQLMRLRKALIAYDPDIAVTA